MFDRLLRLEDVMERVGLCRTAIYNEIKAGTFPHPRKRGRTALWVESEVNAWVEAIKNE